MSVEISHEIEHMRPAYKRFSARWKMPEELGRMGPFRLDVMKAVIAAMGEAGVPDDAYVQWNYPDAWANWERPLP